MSCGELSATETKTVREQCCYLENYLGDTLDDQIKNSIHQRLIELMYERVRGDILILPSTNMTLMTKHINELNEMLKIIQVRNLSEFKYIAKASEL